VHYTTHEDTKAPEAGIQRIIRAGFLLCICAAAGAGPEDIVVEGYRSPEGGRWFIWEITNHGSEPVTYFKAPHAWGYTIDPPPGWKGEIVRDPRRGTVECRTEDRIDAVRRGHPRAFKLEVKGDYRPAPNKVTIGFADGTRIQIPNVACPARYSFLRDHFPAVGLGGMFALFILIRTVRARKKKSVSIIETD
jgi:hypothetical protein